MSQETEQFLQAEQSAQQLLESLAHLKNEATSYKTSAAELDIVRGRLVGLIESIQAVAKDTNEVVQLLKSIGGPEIFRKLEGLKTIALIGIAAAFLSLIGVTILLLK